MLLTLNYIKEESIYVKKDHPYLMTPRISHVIKMWNKSHSEYTCLLTPRTSAELRMESAKVRRTLRFWFQSYYITKELEVEGSWNHHSHINRIDSLKVILFTIWYHLYNLKSVKNTHRRVFILKARNFNKSNTPPWVFFTFFKLQKQYQIAQNVLKVLLCF